MNEPITKEKLAAILESHRKWQANQADGERANLGGADLGGADLRGAHLRGADLREAYLGGADLRGADLGGAGLGGAYLRGATLEWANLGRADLGRADLRGAYLGRADLRGAYLRGADLEGADLRGAYVSWLSHAMLSEILWRDAGDNIDRQMLSAWIGRKTAWCWSQLLDHPHPEREWALDTLAGWVKDGDNAPQEIAARAKSLTTTKETT